MSDLITASTSGTPQLILARPPQTDFELWVTLQVLWGVKIPRTRVCPDHVAPFTAYADAFFARHPVSIWKASRGFGGKSWTLACLGLTESVLFAAKVNLLGGSAAQSLNVHEHMMDMWYSPCAPNHLLASDPTKFETRLTHGGKVRALMASSRSVRGPHPHRLRLDEIDEMDVTILDAAMGMPQMAPTNMVAKLRAQTVMSSTHQYPDGTMSEMLRRAREKQWPVHTWCYRESCNPIDGWLDPEQIEQKKQEVTAAMFTVEYDLQEPAIEGRAMDSMKVRRMFNKQVAVYEGSVGERIIVAESEAGVRYATGVDWGRKRDYTVITTFRMDTWEMVAFERTHKEEWPIMIEKALRRLRAYPGLMAHDATGLGDVISGMIPNQWRELNAIEDIVLVGNLRAAIFSEYVLAVEQSSFKCPYIDWAFEEHLYCTIDDLYRAGDKYHPPDSVVSFALAWWLRSKQIAWGGLPTTDELGQDSYWTTLEIPLDAFG